MRVLWVKRTGVIWSQFSQHLEILACFFGDDVSIHCGNLCWRKTLFVGYLHGRTTPKTPNMSDGRGRFLTVQPESRRLLSPLTPTKKISVWKTKIVGFFCWGSQMRQVQVQGGWAHSLVGEGTVFLGGFFLNQPKNCPKESAWLLLGSRLSNLGGSFEIKDLKCHFFLKWHINSRAKWFENLSRPIIIQGQWCVWVKFLLCKNLRPWSVVTNTWACAMKILQMCELLGSKLPKYIHMIGDGSATQQ